MVKPMCVVNTVDCVIIMMVSMSLRICSGSPGNFVGLLKAFMQIMYLLSMLLMHLLYMLRLVLALVLPTLEIMLCLTKLTLSYLSSLLSCHVNLVSISLRKAGVPG